MKQKIIIILTALFITQLVCQIASAQANVVLQDNEIPGMIIERPVRITHWPITIDPKGMPVFVEAVEQYAIIQDLKVSIKYAEFANTNEAHRAAEWYSKNHQSVFYPGLWNGATNKSIGDESWYSSDAGGNAILFRSGRICVLGGCIGVGNKEKQNQVAELLAKPVEDKIKQGGHVILPYDEPECRLLQARVTLKPEVLEMSPGVLTAFVRLPEGYPVSGIISATCDGAPAERMTLSDDKKEMIIKFRRKDIEEALAQWGGILDTQFVVRGEWKGEWKSRDFHGTASIKKIISPKSK